MSVTLLVFMYLLSTNRADLLWTISIWSGVSGRVSIWTLDCTTVGQVGP